MKITIELKHVLDDNYEKMQQESASIDRLNKEIEFFESFIPEFFSKNGEAQGIRDMYKGIRDNIAMESTITCLDLNKISEVYNEYMEGMIQFINDVNNLDTITESEEFSDYTEKFNNAKANADKFMETLYSGKSKYSKFEDMVLSEAVMNIEHLIDFIPKMNEMKAICNNFNKMVKECTDEKKKTLLDDSVQLLYESVGAYSHSTISNIIETYSNINEALNTENKKEEKRSVFRLF